MRRLVLSTVALLAALVSGPNLFAKGPSEGLTVTQWVQPEQVGEFRARVVVPAENGRTFAVEQARVTLLGVDGKVFRGVTNHRGEVTLSGVTPGVYAMTASGRKSFACYAMYVQDPDQTPGHALPAVAEIPCALVELDQFKSTTMPYMSSSAKRQNLKLGQTEQAGRLVKTQVSQVFRSPGDLVGHVIASPEIPASKTNVMLMRYGGKVRRSVSDDSGRFEFSEVEPGLYSLLAVGPHGIAAVGFEVVEQTRELSLNHSEGARFVSLMQETPEELNVLVAPVTQDELEDADEDGEEEEEEDQGEDDEEDDDEGMLVELDDVSPDGLVSPLPGGGFTSSGGGAGGGFGGGGGLGAIAAGAGIAGVIVATTDDDNNVIIASPITPN